MSDAILEPDDIFAASGSPATKFITLSRMADQKFDQLGSRINADLDFLQYQYMTQLTALANSLGIDGLAPTDTMPIGTVQWKQFRASVYTARTQAALLPSQSENGYEARVELSSSSDSRIRHAINRLRDLINDADVGEKKRQRILSRLAELEKAVNEDRVSLGATLQVIAAVATIFGGTMSGLAKAPEAMSVIFEVVQLIGEEQESRELLQIAAPQKLLPSPDHVRSELVEDIGEVN